MTCPVGTQCSCLIINYIHLLGSVYNQVQWNPNFLNLQGKRKLVREIGEFEKSGVKLQCLTEDRERILVRVIGRFEKLRVREIEIPLYAWVLN